LPSSVIQGLRPDKAGKEGKNPKVLVCDEGSGVSLMAEVMQMHR